jgi:hypothetical protein
LSRDPLDLHPVVRPLLARLQDTCLERLGITLDLVETWRDGAAQAAALAAGASNKPAGTSWHNLTYPNGKPCSFAFHVDPFPGPPVLGYGPKVLRWPGCHTVPVELKPGKQTPCSAAELLLTAVALIGEELGLTIGARWEHPRDWLHFEYHPDGATQAQVAALLAHEGDIAVGGFRG